MRKALKKCLRSWHRLQYEPVVKCAPKDASTFDRMIVIFHESRSDIYRVLFYRSKTDEIFGGA
jgi:hypothetical protein